jgi:hypothetical protein
MITLDYNCLCPYPHSYRCPYPYPYLNGPHADERRKRAQFFCDATLLYPWDVPFPAHQNLNLSPYADHLTLWADLESRIYVMIEPYGNPEKHASELDATGTPWISVPTKFAPYGGDTSTYLLAFPWHADLLRAIGHALNSR